MHSTARQHHLLTLICAAAMLVTAGCGGGDGGTTSEPTATTGSTGEPSVTTASASEDDGPPSSDIGMFSKQLSDDAVTERRNLAHLMPARWQWPKKKFRRCGPAPCPHRALPGPLF